MATYSAQASLAIAYLGRSRNIECGQCGFAHELCRGQVGTAGTAHWPVCKFCKQGIKCDPNTTKVVMINGIACWEMVSCDPACHGYALDGTSPLNPQANPYVPPTTVASPLIPQALVDDIKKLVDGIEYTRSMSEDMRQHRRIILRDRVRAALATMQVLDHSNDSYTNFQTKEFDVTNTDPLQIQCDFCDEYVIVSMKTNPDDAIRGPASMFRCRKYRQVDDDADTDDDWTP